jgi:hypothetical protein
MLGVVVLSADPGGTADGSQALERIGSAERQIEAEERVAVAWLAGVITGRKRRAVQAHRHLHPDRAEVTMTSLQPAPQPACHHRQHRIVDSLCSSIRPHPTKACQRSGVRSVRGMRRCPRHARDRYDSGWPSTPVDTTTGCAARCCSCTGPAQ